MMAAGFEESYIRLWSLKGDSLSSMKSDFQTHNVRDGTLFGLSDLSHVS